MKAVVITQPGEPEVLQWTEQPTPVPAHDEVLVQVLAAGINRPDIMQRQGKYPPPPGVPQHIPGLEIAGIVTQCGEAVTRWAPGDKVCALVGGGGYAEYCTVPAAQCLPMPVALSYAAAASLPETVYTVWSNLFQRGQLQQGERVLIHGGSSGIGVTAIQLAKAFGATVFATAGSAEKCRACEDLGATTCINYRTADFEAVLQSQGVHVILDMIGGDYIPKNLRLLVPDGRLVFINTMKGSKAEIDMHYIMRQRITITGSTLRNREAAFKAALTKAVEQKVWPLIDSGKFQPVVYKTFLFTEAAAAHRLLESSEHIGKLVLVRES
ncbi:NAD(P)H-quinone oxidoreductase [Deminuibacter soli]|uniref:NAD(P)H-quinone oxidoreductase n=1 Tax=Deminuibacter soli TaxID=2291815 RepID=A0A3E1NEL6_9BACT|nr:NAD(P)H-quinone oxidoreductase [Deminuibacter soli]RFM26244.1 NAD(P)H-quinone oxidoreductase [Deminuibacter soli]